MTPFSGADLEQRRVLLAARRGRSVSPGRNMTTNSGARLELLPVALRGELRDVVAHLARVVCEVQRPRRVVVGLERVEVAPPAAPSRRRRRCLPPGRRTTRSGRSTPPVGVARVACSTKSQYESIPASSTTRRSWISPQRPRTCGARSAVTRLPSRCAAAPAPCASAAPAASACRRPGGALGSSAFVSLAEPLSDSRIGARAASAASSRNESLLRRSASAASACEALDSFASADASSCARQRAPLERRARQLRAARRAQAPPAAPRPRAPSRSRGGEAAEGEPNSGPRIRPTSDRPVGRHGGGRSRPAQLALGVPPPAVSLPETGVPAPPMPLSAPPMPLVVPLAIVPPAALGGASPPAPRERRLLAVFAACSMHSSRPLGTTVSRRRPPCRVRAACRGTPSRSACRSSPGSCPTRRTSAAAGEHAFDDGRRRAYADGDGVVLDRRPAGRDAAGLRAAPRAGAARGTPSSARSRRGEHLLAEAGTGTGQEPRLPASGARVRPAGRRRDGDEGAAGAAPDEGRPDRGRRARPPGRRRRPQGPPELPVPEEPAGARAARRRADADGRGRARPTTSCGRGSSRPRPATAPSSTRAVADAVGGARRRRRPLRRPPLPVPLDLLRRGGARPGRRRRARDREPRALLRRRRAARPTATAGVLPPHDAVVFDEAHRLEESAATWLGGRVSRGRRCAASCATSSAAAARPTSPRPPRAFDRVERACERLLRAVSPPSGRRRLREPPLELGLDARRRARRRSPTRSAGRARSSTRSRGARSARARGRGCLDPDALERVVWAEPDAIAWAPVDVSRRRCASCSGTTGRPRCSSRRR